MDKIPAELAKKFGFEGEMTEEDFVKAHNERFINREYVTDDENTKQKFDLVNFKQTEKAIVSTFKDFGIEFTEDMLKAEGGKREKYENILKKGLSQIKNSYEGKIKEFEGKKKPNEELKEWEEKYTKAVKDYEDLKGLHSGTVNEFNTFKQSVAEKEKSNQINYAFGSLLKEVKSGIKPNATPLEIEGWESRIEKSFKRDVDSEGNLILFNDKGERIKSKTQIGAFASPKEILESLRDELGLGIKNPDGGKEVKPPVKSEMPPATPQPRVNNWLSATRK